MKDRPWEIKAKEKGKKHLNKEWHKQEDADS